MYDFLIAVATVNGPDRLEAFIQSVIKYTDGLNYAISICDDCSEQEFAESNYAIAVKYGCFYRKNDKRSGVPYSWNRACETADSKYLIIANDDVLVVPGWLHSFDAFMAANSHLNIGVVAWPATNILSEIKYNWKFCVSIDESHVTTPIVACSGYLFGVSRQQYLSMGRFDERYFATWEEIDFGAKLCMNGMKSIGMSGPIVYHEGGASFRDPINQHPAMQKQSQAQGQWIDKWSTILGIDVSGHSSSSLIKMISDMLTSKIPKYSIDDFQSVNIDVLNFIKQRPVEPREDIDGWFDWPDLYRRIVQEAPDNSQFVEVGSWMGKSICFLSEIVDRTNKKIKIYAVDIWSMDSSEPAFRSAIMKANDNSTDLFSIFKNNLARYGVDRMVSPMRMPSTEAAKLFNNSAIDMVFIDADHTYDAVKADVESWWPKIKVGGVMAGHDYLYAEGVKRAVDEFFRPLGIMVTNIGQCWYVKKQ